MLTINAEMIPFSMHNTNPIIFCVMAHATGKIKNNCTFFNIENVPMQRHKSEPPPLTPVMYKKKHQPKA